MVKMVEILTLSIGTGSLFFYDFYHNGYV